MCTVFTGNQTHIRDVSSIVLLIILNTFYIALYNDYCAYGYQWPDFFIFMLFVLVVDLLFSSSQNEHSFIIHSPLCQFTHCEIVKFQLVLHTNLHCGFRILETVPLSF